MQGSMSENNRSMNEAVCRTRHETIACRKANGAINDFISLV